MKKNILIAVTVIVSLCLLYWGIEFLKGINLFTPANFYIAKFDKVDGLVEAAPVTIKGFQVGQIKELNYDYENNEVSIMLSMNKDLKIPVGSAVHIESSLTGAATLALELSDSKAFYKVGDEIPTVRKQGLLDRVSAEVVPQVEQILPQVDSILANVNNLTGDPALYASVARLDAITADLAATSRQLNALIAVLNKQVPGVMNQVDGIAGNLNGTSSNLNQMSSSLLALPIDSTMNRLNTTVANLQLLSERLNDKNSSLGLLLNDASLYNNANSAIMNLDSLFIDVKQHPKRYINLKVF